MSHNHSNSLRMQSAHKHDQNTYLDLFVCNCPIKHILCISISGLWSQWELLAEKCCAFKLQGTVMWAMFREGGWKNKSGLLPKCCTTKRGKVTFRKPRRVLVQLRNVGAIFIWNSGETSQSVFFFSFVYLFKQHPFLTAFSFYLPTS